MVCCHCGLPINGAAIVKGNEIVHNGCIEGYSLAIRGYTHKCPSCNGRGKVKDETRTITEKVKCSDPNDSPCAWNGCRGCSMCGFKMVEMHPDVKCNLCNGVGYLKYEPTPVVKVVGWVKDE